MSVGKVKTCSSYIQKFLDFVDINIQINEFINM